jgi:hypothetical protein
MTAVTPAEEQAVWYSLDATEVAAKLGVETAQGLSAGTAT